jgi:Spy/CpxP family protein refolding chaperone
MSRKAVSVTLVVLLVLGMAAVPSIAAETAKEDGGTQLAGPRPLARLIMGNIGRFLVLRSELNISADQKKKIAAEIKGHKDEIRPVAQEIFEKRTALRDAVLNKPDDRQAIMAAANDLGKAIGDAAVVASKVIAKVKTLLTSEQQERIKNFRMANDKATGEWISQIGQ